jgi:ribosome maturation factor RimP
MKNNFKDKDMSISICEKLSKSVSSLLTNSDLREKESLLEGTDIIHLSMRNR